MKNMKRGNKKEYEIMGEEPEAKENPTDSELGEAYNWYNYFYDRSSAAKFLYTYFKKEGMLTELVAIKSLPTNAIPVTVSTIARLLTNGWKLNERSMVFFDKEIKELVARSVASKEKNKKKQEDNRPIAPKLTVQDHLNNRANELIGDIECEIDPVIRGEEFDFDIYNFLKENDVNAQVSRKIHSYYNGVLGEVEQAYNKDDKELIEAYNCYSRKELKHLKECLSSIVTDVDMWADNKNRQRAPRKKKKVSTSKQISKIQYLTKDDEYKIVSVDPINIVGAIQLWTFEPKYKKLTVYHAKDKNGFAVKGTTLQNFDEKTSECKIVRKPDTAIKNVLDGGKVKLKKIMSELKTKEQQPTGRINKNTVLLRTLK